MFKKLTKTTTTATVKGAKATGKGTLFVTDYTELGVDKAVDKVHFGIEKTVDGVKIAGRGVKVAGVRTKVAWINHRNNHAERILERQIKREERKALKAKPQVPDATTAAMQV